MLDAAFFSTPSDALARQALGHQSRPGHRRSCAPPSSSLPVAGLSITLYACDTRVKFDPRGNYRGYGLVNRICRRHLRTRAATSAVASGRARRKRRLVVRWYGMASRYEDYTRVYLSHSRESSQAIHTHSHTICTLFAQSSHRSHSYSHTIRTVSHYSHTIRTVAHYLHTIRTVARYSHGRTLFAVHTFCTVAHYSRGSHTICAIFTPNSQTIRTSSHPGHTIRAVGASPFALIHAIFAQFTPVRIYECAIGTL